MTPRDAIIAYAELLLYLAVAIALAAGLLYALYFVVRKIIEWLSK